MPSYLTNVLPGRTVTLENGDSYLWFSGTDYLGMGSNTDFRKYLSEGFERYGSHFGSSRNNSLQLGIYQEVETALSNYTRAPAALTVSSGMWAGQLVMKEIENIVRNFTISTLFHPFKYHYSPKVHPALWGNNYSANYSTWEEWAYQTIRLVHESPENTPHIICTDSVGSPWVESFDFSIFNILPTRQNIFLVVDDSHGIGVSGDSGRGIFAKISKLAATKVIVVASLNKGMGIPAGVILTDENIIPILRNSPWFSGASPCLPAYGFALTNFLDSDGYITPFQNMLSNIQYFKAKIAQTRIFRGIDDYPVLCTKDPSLFQFLFEHGIMSSSFPYPLATDLPVTRLVISALHQKEDLDQLAEVCLKFQAES